jgi:hypothetical protein
MSDEGYQVDNHPERGKRASNRIGLQEIDEDGALWLSHGKVYSCTGAAYSEEKEDMQ